MAEGESRPGVFRSGIHAVRGNSHSNPTTPRARKYGPPSDLIDDISSHQDAECWSKGDASKDEGVGESSVFFAEVSAKDFAVGGDRDRFSNA